MEEKKNENQEKNVEQSQIYLERYRKACQNRRVRMYGRVDTAANGAAEGPLLAHASREDSGVISAKERTVANGISVTGVGIGES